MSWPAPAPLAGSLAETAAALHAREVSAVELTRAALERHERLGERMHAYKHFDADAAMAAARAADQLLAKGDGAPPLCGIPVSVKDIYGVEGMPTYAGSAHRLPDSTWSRDGWLVERLRSSGAVIVGKTHTVEFAYGGVGMNPHWGTPHNPWDADVARIPGGSSCGAGVSLWEGSAMLALGSDTGGSIRIPAAFTGVVGHKTTKGRLPTDGVTQLSSTFDTLGALTRTVEDSIYFFGCVDPKWGDPRPLLETLEATSTEGLRIRLPECCLWEGCEPDIADVLTGALEELEGAGAVVERSVGTMIDDAYDHYMSGGIGKAEIHAWLLEHLPDWIDRLHPTVGARIEGPLPLDGREYRAALSKHRRMVALGDTLFDDADVLVLPANLISAPTVAEVRDDLSRYKVVNKSTLQPTCPVNMLGMCAISVPVGLDPNGMPVGLQLVARGGEDEALLGVALAAEAVWGDAVTRIGVPPLLRV
ncbi:MAG: amidase [Gemmatimonadota bacterium]|nr:amidase [Gemmatimonadota bacterium]